MLLHFIQQMRLELLITVLIFILLLFKLGKGLPAKVLLTLVLLMLFGGVLLAFTGPSSGSLFAGMFVVDPLQLVQKSILMGATMLLLMLNYDWLKKQEHLTEFLILLLAALLGMLLMISAGHLLLFYLALELSTIPVAALANFELDKKRSSEAALKMIYSSAFSSAILLFGISLLYGATGTLDMTELTKGLSWTPLVIMGMVFFLSGIAFKLSAVPFHLWTADVYEGAPIAVTAFLSVISKAATAFVLAGGLLKMLRPLSSVWLSLLLLLVVATLLVANLFALRQQNLKRFIAFSSITQVGFVLLCLMGGSVALAPATITYFFLIYSFTNLAALGIIGIVAANPEQERLSYWQGLYRNNKMLSWMMAIALFSLAGVPPTAGFFGKFFLIMVGAPFTGIYLLITVFVALTLVISLYYYLRVVRAIFIDRGEQEIPVVRVGPVAKLALWICLAAILLIGFFGSIYSALFQISS